MKKIYLAIFTICLTAIGVNAQVELTDDFESYNLGDVSPQATHWRTWAAPGTSADDANVVDIFGQSGFQSLNIDGSGVQDMILKVPSLPTSGIYTIQFGMYIPAGKEGYFNMQGADTPDGTPWGQHLNGGNVYFNEASAGGGDGTVDGTPGQTFSYPEDEWFTVTLTYDLDGLSWGMDINGVNQFVGQEFTFNDPFVELAGINFFSVSTSNEYYLDDIVLAVGLLGTEDIEAKGFQSAMSNGTLVLRAQENINSVAIYNMLGQQVYNANVNSMNSTVDMTNLANGTYIVKVNINGVEGSVKVIR